MAITQTITTIPTAGHRGVDARDTFVEKQEAFQDALTDNFVTEINAFRTQANDLETNVNAKESTVVAKEALVSPHYNSIDTVSDNISSVVANSTNITDIKNAYENAQLAISAKDIAIIARDEAVGAVATLPDGIINDGVVSATDTWSSQKIDSEKQGTLVSGTNIKTVNGASVLGSGDITVTSILNVEYDNRASLRTLTPVNGEKALVKGLGLFIYNLSSTEIDDDETSFRTASGTWLLECPTYDFIQAQLGYYERMFTGVATNTILTVAITATAYQDITVNGAFAGMSAVASLEGFNNGRLAISAYVVAPNTVRVVVSNPSEAVGAALPLNNWAVAVFAQN